MQVKSQHPEPNQWINESDTAMSAVESLITDLFEEADNDSMYHHSVAYVLAAYQNGLVPFDSEELAIRILAWSQAL